MNQSRPAPVSGMTLGAFVVLSKLLPPLFYPLGSSCLLILISLGLSKRPKLQRGLLLTAVGLLWISSTPLGSRLVLGPLERQYAGASDAPALPMADAIVVLGGGVKPQNPPRPWVEVNEAGDRPLYAAYLYKLGKAPRLILSGGRLSFGEMPTSSQVPDSEAQDMQQILRVMGVPDQAILLESQSVNTYENAVNVQRILRQENLQRILLVTSAWHMPRAIAIFRRLGMTAIAAPTDFRIEQISEPPTLANFVLDLLPDATLLAQTTIGLKEHWGLWVYRLRGWAE
jgi:uncharacterized SAM-binding protein YcdF (DUF218 family)